MTPSMGPSAIWAKAEHTATETSIGCAMCVFAGIEKQVETIYLWGGSSYCSQHLKELQTNAK